MAQICRKPWRHTCFRIYPRRGRLYKMTADERQTTFDDVIEISESMRLIKQRFLP